MVFEVRVSHELHNGVLVFVPFLILPKIQFTFLTAIEQ